MTTFTIYLEAEDGEREVYARTTVLRDVQRLLTQAMTHNPDKVARVERAEVNA